MYPFYQREFLKWDSVVKNNFYMIRINTIEISRRNKIFLQQKIQAHIIYLKYCIIENVLLFLILSFYYFLYLWVLDLHSQSRDNVI